MKDFRFKRRWYRVRMAMVSPSGKSAELCLSIDSVDSWCPLFWTSLERAIGRDVDEYDSLGPIIIDPENSSAFLYQIVGGDDWEICVNSDYVPPLRRWLHSLDEDMMNSDNAILITSVVSDVEEISITPEDGLEDGSNEW